MKNRRTQVSVVCWLFAVLTLSVSGLSAAPLAVEDVPTPLKSWIPWVMQDDPGHSCPYAYNNNAARRCLWPSRAEFNLTEKGGTFSQEVQTYREVWVPLPGDAKLWPQDVKVNGKAVPLIAQGEEPGVQLAIGVHSITGAFVWNTLPESLPTPTWLGLLALTLNGNPYAVPNIDPQGRLWLKQQSPAADGAGGVEIRAHRLVSDDIPMILTTHLEIIASGKSQEVTIPLALLPGFVPQSLDSPLPARFEANNALRIQVRPGRWQVLATGRHMAPQKSLTLPASDSELAPKEEVWAFDARNQLRMLTLDGVPSIDPQQTTLPDDWKRFPAFKLKAGDTLQLNETKRGDPEPAPDQLSLVRAIWLDFDGKGYTVQDQMQGSVTRTWRLEMPKPQVLGRVAVDGVDQYVTTLDANSPPGFELRRGKAAISADSRIDSPTREFSAAGWLHDFNQLSAVLQLPPGWRLFHANGVDRAEHSWVERWTLLDIFLVLIIALACGRLFGWVWGAVALVALGLAYHEIGAPTWAWLNLLAALALLRVLPDGRVSRVIEIYRWLAALALVLMLIPFAVDQIRQMIYPVLERPWEVVGQGVGVSPPAAAVDAVESATVVGAAAPPAAPADAPAQEAAVIAEQAEEQGEAKAKRALPSISSKSDNAGKESYSRSAYQVLDQIDPNAKVQTGPGLPNWQWNAHNLQWSGPVSREQKLHLWLISPALNGVLTILRLALMLALLARLVSLALPTIPGIARRAATSATAVIALAFWWPHGGHAAVQADAPAPEQKLVAPIPPSPEPPSTQILRELHERLTRPAECLPNCAEIPRLAVAASAAQLLLRLEVHMASDSAVPLPGSAREWRPQRVMLNGLPARALLRDENGVLWIELARGVHQITMEAGTSEQDTIQIAFPLKPRRVESNVKGWTLDGVNEDGTAGESLLLTRIAKSGDAVGKVSGDSLPPFVSVDRMLNLGLAWQVTTKVARASPSRAPVLVSIVLLEGESVTNTDVRVENGMALVNLGPQTSEFSFDSALKIQDKLTLTAPKAPEQIQRWALNLGLQWHVIMAGIPVVHHYQGGDSQWLPQWQPWPGEQVTLNFSKPAGVAGQSLTMDRSALAITPGMRATDAQLTLTLRSSRGGQHSIELPDQSALQSVAINGQTQPIRQEGRKVTLPVTPGKQEVTIVWREQRGMATRFITSLVNLGIPGVNGSLHVKLPQDRWLLFLGGPSIGPAILFWGVVIALILIALALHRVTFTPLKFHHWLLLGLGLTQAPFIVSAVIVGWFILLGLRRRYGDRFASNRWFNVGQVILLLWTITAVAGLFSAVQQGLLGYPEMQVSGNGSNSVDLNWYQDRTAPTLPTAWLVSMPLLAYRLLMLLWALWLAYALLKWVRWGWDCFSDHGFWRKTEFWKPAAPKRGRRLTPDQTAPADDSKGAA